MKLTSRLAAGAYAGLSGGIAIAIFFLVADLVRLQPLSTPLALGETFLGPGGTTLDLPVVAMAVTLASTGLRLLTFSVVHLAAFAALGVAAVLLFDVFGWKLNVGSGALFGLIGCSTVFYASLALAGSGVVAELPSLGAVLVGNLIAGALIGGQVQLLRAPK